jgi:hypothetical protein
VLLIRCYYYPTGDLLDKVIYDDKMAVRWQATVEYMGKNDELSRTLFFESEGMND